MRNFLTYVLLRQETLETITVTEPCETGWASEAIFFLHIQSTDNSTYTVTVKAQISVDGINWIDHEILPLMIHSDGHYFLKMKEFGGWLRLFIHTTQSENCIATVQLALKE